MNYSTRIRSLLMVIFLWNIHIAYTQDNEIFKNQIEQVLNDLKSYHFGDNRLWSTPYRELFKEAYQDEDHRKVLESSLLNFLDHGQATNDAKKEVLYSIGPISSELAVDAFLNQMKEKETFNAALYAISFLHSADIHKKLLKVLKKSEKDESYAIINTLGDIGDPDVIPALKKRLEKNTEPIIPVLDALGDIPTRGSADVLLSSMSTLKGEERWVAADNLLQVATSLNQDGVPVIGFYEAVYQSEPPVTLAIGALKGMIDVGQEPLDQLTEIFRSDRSELKEASMRVVSGLRKDPPMTFINAGLNILEQPIKSQFLLALASRNDPRVKGIALDAIKDQEEIAHLAGAQALLILGGADEVELMAQLAAQSRGKVREVARRCLYTWKGSQVDEQIIALMKKADGDYKEELILCVGPRLLTSSLDILLGAIRDENSKVSVAALKMLGEIGEPKILPQLLSYLDGLSSRQVENEYIKTVSRIANKADDKEAKSDVVVSVLEEEQNEDHKGVLIEIMGNLGNETAYEKIKSYLSDPNEQIRIAAVKSLSSWSSDQPVDDLRQLYKKTDDLKQHTLALIGIEKLVNTSDQYNKNEKAEVLIELLKGSLTLNERKIVLSGLGKTGSLITFEVANELLKSETLKSEAEAAIIENFRNVDQDENAGLIQGYLQKISNNSTNEDFKKRISRWLD